jgi:hypothetical protein
MGVQNRGRASLFACSAQGIRYLGDALQAPRCIGSTPATPAVWLPVRTRFTEGNRE